MSRYFRLVLLCTASVLPSVETGRATHSSWSQCSRTCGGGVSAWTSRRCTTSEPSSCHRHVHLFRMCNTQPCPSWSLDFRLEQCQKQGVSKVGGSTTDWQVSTNPLEPCALNCMDTRTGRIVRMNALVKDGTKCSTDSKDVCILGRCRRVGCDGILGSQRRINACGVCGGSSDSCSDKSEHYWSQDNFTSCSATCGKGVRHALITCLARKTGQVVEDRLCKEAKPQAKKEVCKAPDCLPVWFVGPWQSCSTSCGPGVSSREVHCTVGSREVKQNLCVQAKPANTRDCSSNPCARWQAQPWKHCTVTCGGGEQQRDVTCLIGDVQSDSRQCDQKQRPQDKRKCNMQRCRSYTAFTTTARVLPRFRLTSYIVGKWSGCSASCGMGHRRRDVQCRVFLPFSQAVMDIPEEECKEVRPPEVLSCQVKPCELPAKDAAVEAKPVKDSTSSAVDSNTSTGNSTASVEGEVEWRESGYSACSTSCGGGEQTAISQCYLISTQRLLRADACLEQVGPPPEMRRACNTQSCAARWLPQPYGPCSAWCGGGSRRRVVLCVTELFGNTRLLPDSECNAPRPSSSRPCAVADCPPHWSTGPWSQCSSTCAGGSAYRQLFCRQRLSTGIEVQHRNTTKCHQVALPDHKKACGNNYAVCSQGENKPVIGVEQLDTIQMRPMKKLNVVVGGSVTVIPATTLIIRCPVTKFNQRNVRWQKNGRYVRLRRRVQVTHKGALKIRNSKLHDAATYTCVAVDTRADITLKLQTYETGKELYKARASFLRKMRNTERRGIKSRGKRLLEDQTANASTSKKKRKKKRRAGTLGFVAGAWSLCSATCETGVRTRQVRCEQVYKNYFRVLPDSECKASHQQRPTEAEPCQLVPVCAQWKTELWSECQKSPCVASGVATRQRIVSCISKNGTELETKFCDATQRPLEKEKCLQTECKTLWKPSAWGGCSSTCLRSRTLSCLWYNDGRKAADKLCTHLPRPNVTEQCDPTVCQRRMQDSTVDRGIQSSPCMDSLQFCSLIGMLDMCQYDTYKLQCCHSCSVKQ